MSLAVDPYVVDVLMPDLVGHDRSPSAFLVYLFLWRRGASKRGAGAAVSLREIAEGTGLSKRGAQGALARLKRRRLVATEHASATAVPHYRVLRPWRR
jgi:DNA-binding MarR family transcriptional regulator